MEGVTVIKGEIFEDRRGQIASVNNLSFDQIKRTYILHHPDTSIVRGWNGHKHEKKWFYCHRGAFTLKLVAIDNWEKPGKDLKIDTFNLNSNTSEIICVPSGYASSIKAEIPDSILQVFSDKTFAEAISEKDSFSFDSDYFKKSKS